MIMIRSVLKRQRRTAFTGVIGGHTDGLALFAMVGKYHILKLTK